MKVLIADQSKCRGSGACVTACAQTLHKTTNAAFSSIQLRRGDGRRELLVCDQCGDCIAVCPAGAIYRAKSGIVMVKKDLCVGCFMCAGFCDRNGMFAAPGKTEPVKCISCGNCVDACVHGALSIVVKDHAGLPA